jgi:hypothetical protein
VSGSRFSELGQYRINVVKRLVNFFAHLRKKKKKRKDSSVSTVQQPLSLKRESTDLSTSQDDFARYKDQKYHLRFHHPIDQPRKKLKSRSLSATMLSPHISSTIGGINVRSLTSGSYDEKCPWL